MTVSGQFPALHLLHGPPKTDMTNTDATMTYYREPSHSWESVGCVTTARPSYLWVTLQGLLAQEVIYPCALIWHKVRDMATIHNQTWESPKTPIPTVQEYQGKPWVSKILYKKKKGIIWNFIRLNRDSQLTFADRVKVGNKLKLLRIAFLWAGRKSQSEKRFSCPQVELRTRYNKSSSNIQTALWGSDSHSSHDCDNN